MVNYDPSARLPSSKELPDSDDTPVDNQLQKSIPDLLRSVLAMAWAERMDWFFGIRMGMYYDPGLPAIVPDAFLSLGVKRFYDENLRPSYVLWEEKKLPILVLEVVSQIYRGEYSTKKAEYARLGFLYYVIYNPLRCDKPRLEVYKLVNNVYEFQDGNPVWLPEISLGIGIEQGTYLGIPREWMYWYNQQGQRLLTPQEQAQLAQQRAQLLAERLRSLGIDPDLI
ncbi:MULTISPECIES: Uma2 family endonuclease [unclassified Nostoc]|uniref:Uma2 family endonuclease n=1 Tax=unclassified Nostoc TaxID=2593658 RepID=UPI002AD33AE5|nr:MULTISPECIES: Uma2 family endonuclease [unclassified Nostoc]MDZ8121263.1 Uma2 family endonuclease [Nostoc sp. CmiVER01]MDZ8224194.1 Uma2 family endonuclease [Nostoc sp. ChiVER01]